jgi:uncharacterized protein with von Willebrand factor type A (vWA) domain
VQKDSFKKSGKNKKKKRLHFASIKEYFTEKWGGLLMQKQIKRELDFIEAERKKFCEELYQRIEELKKLQVLLAPFTGELGRLWDMSRGHWQNINFDVLKKYAEFLEKDTSLQKLAEMLGRLWQAEKKYEKELFRDIVIKPEWKVTHAGKADLVGVHKSDDISSMLPAEAALLGDETTELLFYKKFAEKKKKIKKAPSLSALIPAALCMECRKQSPRHSVLPCLEPPSGIIGNVI